MPTLNPWVLLGTLASAIALIFGGYAWGSSAKNNYWLSRINADKAAAVQQALTTERDRQEKANAAIRQQAADQAAINNRLRADLAGLRNRPERATNVSAGSRPACTGANGAELARIDAEFLVQFAAIAADQDAALSACYQVMDSLQPR